MRRKLLKILFSGMIVFLWAGYVGAQEKFLFVVDEANPPFMYKNEVTGAASGLYPILIRAIFKKMDKIAEVASYPWKRVLQMGENGEAGVGGIYKNEKRLAVFDYSDPIFDEKLVFYVKKGNAFAYKNIADLSNKTIGVIRGWSYGDDFDKAKEKRVFKTEETESDELNMKKLAHGRLDCVVAIQQSGDMIISKLGYQSQIEMLETPLSVNSTYIVFTKKSNKEALIREFNHALKVMKQDGSYQAVVKSVFQ